jgi:hypothetical protein
MHSQMGSLLPSVSQSPLQSLLPLELQSLWELLLLWA